jgi:Ca2+-binding RTX toxin-like protein
VERGTDGKVFVDVAVEDAATIPTYVNLFSNGATITQSVDGPVIRFSFDANMSGVGYENLTTSTQIGSSSRYAVNGESNGRDLWIAPDDRNFDFADVGTHTIHVGDPEIESSDDIIISGGGADSIRAGAGWDWISGGAGNDTIHGGDENDTIFGGAGNDVLYGGNQFDYLEGGAGADTINGASQGQTDTYFSDGGTAGYRTSNEAVQINLETHTATGGHASGDSLSFISNLVGSNFNDLLIGNTNFSNWLEGGAGADTLNGGGGPADYDRASYLHASAGVLASLEQPWLNSGDAAGDIYISIEGLHGSQFNDILIGDAGDNILSGDAGDDLLVAGNGMDTINGGFGFDVLSYKNLSEAVIIDLSQWTSSSAMVADDVVIAQITGSTSSIEAYEATDFNDTMRGSALDDVLMGRAGNDNIIGNDGNDSLFGGDGVDFLDGGSGSDSMVGGLGDDIYVVDSTNDSVLEVAGGGNDTVQSTITYTLGAEVETLVLSGTLAIDGTGNALANVLSGNAAANRLVGDGGNDTLHGGDGADTLNGGDGDDSIIGGDTSSDLRDVVFAGAGHDFADGGSGNDELNGMDGNDTLAGGDGADTVIGGNGDDVITGSAFADLIFGNAGNDFLNGGFGSDAMNGGAGADKFFHAGVAGHGSDWVQDYLSTEGDVLVFGQAGATANDFQVNAANAGSGDAGVNEAFVIYRPTGQILWALVDGMGNDEINLQISGSGEVFDLLA